MIDKTHILAEIKRTAAENDGSALGQERFRAETGIKKSDWFGIHWVKWGEALAEAGFAPNQLQSAYDEEHLLVKFASLIRELRRFPVDGDLRMKARRDRDFPSHTTFSRFGNKQQRITKILDFCKTHPSYEDVAAICAPLLSAASDPTEPVVSDDSSEMGFVYLLKSGRYYKIGRTNAVDRRHRELAIQLPEKAKVVHKIKTDDPSGIESYWHKRFADRHKNGEWFELTQADVSAFRRRKFM